MTGIFAIARPGSRPYRKVTDQADWTGQTGTAVPGWSVRSAWPV